MALDVYVMPYWRFFAGQFDSPLKSLFGKGVRRIGGMEFIPEEDARQCSREMCANIARTLGKKHVWEEEGDVLFAEQLRFEPLHILRAFAAYQDYPPRKYWLFGREEFDPGTDPAHHVSIQMVHRKARTSFLHLIVHEDNEGCYVPVNFATPLQMLFDDSRPKDLVNSSYRLLRELDRLAPHVEKLPVTNGWPDSVRYAHSLLTRAARLSIKHNLPIIFDG